jgi:hypothetical protein
MTGRTKGGAQRARTLKAEVRQGGSPVTATPIYHLHTAARTCPRSYIHSELEFISAVPHKDMHAHRQTTYKLTFD